ncbi:Uncharacterised protein [Vibrio cholerae]|nr:Uncharacterised protein [Vibrio cholerae]
MKSTFFLRSSVIDIAAIMASYLRANSEGIMPSQSCGTILHSTCISAHNALAISTTKTHRFPFFGLRYPTDCCGN